MKDEKERFFTVTDGEGNTFEYEILFTFDSDETKKSYMVFTDNARDDDGNIMTYAATYDKTGSELKLENIETDKEWNIIESLLAELDEKSEG